MWTTLTPDTLSVIRDLAGKNLSETDVTQAPGYTPPKEEPDYSGDIISADMGKNAPDVKDPMAPVKLEDNSFDVITEMAREQGDLQPKGVRKKIGSRVRGKVLNPELLEEGAIDKPGVTLEDVTRAQEIARERAEAKHMGPIGHVVGASLDPRIWKGVATETDPALRAGLGQSIGGDLGVQAAFIGGGELAIAGYKAAIPIIEKSLTKYLMSRPPIAATEAAGKRIESTVTGRLAELKQKPVESYTHDDRAFLNHMTMQEEGQILGMGPAVKPKITDPDLHGLSDGEIASYLNRTPHQTISSGDAAVLWLKDRNLYPTQIKPPPEGGLGKYGADWTDAKIEIGRVMEHPDFQRLNKFDQIRVAASLQRPPKRVLYSDELQIPKPDKAGRKMAGSPIVDIDTWRGCKNFCLDCYAAQGPTKPYTGIDQKAFLKGNFDPEGLYRVGTVGDPAAGWGHTVEQLKSTLDRSPGVTPDKNLYFISKLQSIDGLDTSIVRNLEVSLDPLMPDHMMTSMQNVIRLKRKDPSINIFLRIRSFESTNPHLRASQDMAIDFAKQTKLPVLETRVRWKSNNTANLVEADLSKYKSSGPQKKLKQSALKDKIPPEQWHPCNEAELMEGACAKCGACAKFVQTKMGSGPVQIDPFPEKPGTTLGMFYWADPRAGSMFEGRTVKEGKELPGLFTEPTIGRRLYSISDEGSKIKLSDEQIANLPAYLAEHGRPTSFYHGGRKKMANFPTVPLSDLVDMPGLQGELPEYFKQIRVGWDPESKGAYTSVQNKIIGLGPGVFNKQTITSKSQVTKAAIARQRREDLLGSLFHEAQHPITSDAGLVGGNSKMADDLYKAHKTLLEGKIKNLDHAIATYTGTNKKILKDMEKARHSLLTELKKVDAWDQKTTPIEKYRSLVGESLSRAADRLSSIEQEALNYILWEDIVEDLPKGMPSMNLVGNPIIGRKVVMNEEVENATRFPGGTFRLYHGGTGEIKGGRPTFFTDEKWGAKWYAGERGGAEPTIHEVEVTIKNPAGWKDVQDVADALKIDKKKVLEHSPYDGENPIDFIYVPEVRAALKKRGFDGVIASDALENTEILAHIPFDNAQVKPIGKIKGVRDRVKGVLWPEEAQGVTAEDILKSNRTSRAAGAVGQKAITPRYVEETIQKGETVLDFGAGKDAAHTARMREKGINATAHEWGDNVIEGVHDPQALTRKYNTVMASNVINVQSSEKMLQGTIRDMWGSVDEGGRMVFNYPQSPRYMDVSPVQMKKMIEDEIGTSLKQVGGTKAAPLWEATKSTAPEGDTLGMGLGAIWEKIFGKKTPKPQTASRAANQIASSGKRMGPGDFSEVMNTTIEGLAKDPDNAILNDTKRRLFLRLGDYIEGDQITADAFDKMAARYGMTRAEFARHIMEESSRAGQELNRLSQIARKLKELHPEDAELNEVVKQHLNFTNSLPYRWYRKIDNIRRQLLIGQLATSARNIISQGARVGVDIFDDLIFGLANTPKEGARKAFADFMENFNSIGRSMTGEGKVRLELIMKRMDGVKDAMLGDAISDVNALQKGIGWINSINRMQEHYFRRTAFDARISALARKHGLDLLKDDMPDWMIRDAFEHAMEMTFQKSSGFLAEAMRKAYWNVPFLTTINPFPRFWANSVNFMLDFGPVGLAKSAYLAGKKGATDETMRAFSRGMVGTMGIGAAWQLRNSEYAGEKYYEIRVGDKTYDMRAFAPFSTYLAMGEILKGEKSTMTMGDMIQAFVGINRIAGTGLALFDVWKEQVSGGKTGEELSSRSKRVAADVVAQFIGGYTVPLKTVKDALAAIDPSQGILQSTKVDLEAGGAKTMLRPTLANVPYGNLINQVPGMEGTVVPSTSMTRTENIRLENPLTRQLTGFSYKTKTPLEMEIDKLAIDNLRSRTGTPELDRLLSREVAQAGFAEEGNDLVQSEYWKSLDPQERIQEIRKLATEYRDEVRDDTKFEVYDKILSKKKSAMDRYRYILNLVEKGRVNEELLEDLMDEHDTNMNATMIDKIYKTYETKVADPYGPMAGVNTE